MRFSPTQGKRRLPVCVKTRKTPTNPRQSYAKFGKSEPVHYRGNARLDTNQ